MKSFMGELSNKKYLSCAVAGLLILAMAIKLNAGQVVLSDFNNDGLLDLAVADIIRNRVSILLGNGDGTFASRTNYLGTPRPIDLSVGGFNNDENLDLAVSDLLQHTVDILLGDGSGEFRRGVTLPAPRTP